MTEHNPEVPIEITHKITHVIQSRFTIIAAGLELDVNMEFDPAEGWTEEDVSILSRILVESESSLLDNWLQRSFRRKKLLDQYFGGDV